jgi:hypothetical protein
MKLVGTEYPDDILNEIVERRLKKEITKQTGMTMEEYRSFAFHTLYESLVQKKASGE